MDNPTIFGKAQSAILADLGGALGRVKRERGLTLADMGCVLGRVDDMVARYIAGEAEMGIVAWLRASAAWPELAGLMEETEAERALRGRQGRFDLTRPARTEKAA